MASAQLTFGVLGALEVHRDGAAVPLASGRQRAVLAALLVHAGRPVPGDTLVEAAWRDELPANPSAALPTVLSRLRAALDADAIRHDAAGYRLAITSDAVDASLFETLHRAAREAPAADAVGMLERALALWRGPAYGEFADREFAAAEAVRLDELRLACLEELAELRLGGRRCLRRAHRDGEVCRRAPLARASPRVADDGALPGWPFQRGAGRVPRLPDRACRRTRPRPVAGHPRSSSAHPQPRGTTEPSRTTEEPRVYRAVADNGHALSRPGRRGGRTRRTRCAAPACDGHGNRRGGQDPACLGGSPRPRRSTRLAGDCGRTGRR